MIIPKIMPKVGGAAMNKPVRGNSFSFSREKDLLAKFRALLPIRFGTLIFWKSLKRCLETTSHEYTI